MQDNTQRATLDNNDILQEKISVIVNQLHVIDVIGIATSESRDGLLHTVDTRYAVQVFKCKDAICNLSECHASVYSDEMDLIEEFYVDDLAKALAYVHEFSQKHVTVGV